MISTHVLDTARGRPAAGIAVALSMFDDGAGTWLSLMTAATDPDGRVGELLPHGTPLLAGRYRLVFATAAYFAAHATPTFYPAVTVEFDVTDAAQHYHVPLLLSPFGYSTYRGS